MGHRAYSLTGSRTITADWTSPVINNPGYSRCQIYIKVTAIADTPSVIPTLQGKDAVSGDWFNLLVSTAITTTGNVLLTLGPGQSEVDDIDAGVTSGNGFLPKQWRLFMDGTWAGTDAITFTAGATVAP
jgi:hypothetical protein